MVLVLHSSHEPSILATAAPNPEELVVDDLELKFVSQAVLRRALNNSVFNSVESLGAGEIAIRIGPNKAAIRALTGLEKTQCKFVLSVEIQRDKDVV